MRTRNRYLYDSLPSFLNALRLGVRKIPRELEGIDLGFAEDSPRLRAYLRAHPNLVNWHDPAPPAHVIKKLREGDPWQTVVDAYLKDVTNRFPEAPSVSLRAVMQLGIGLEDISITPRDQSRAVGCMKRAGWERYRAVERNEAGQIVKQPWRYRPKGMRFARSMPMEDPRSAAIVHELPDDLAHRPGRRATINLVLPLAPELFLRLEAVRERMPPHTPRLRAIRQALEAGLDVIEANQRAAKRVA